MTNMHKTHMNIHCILVQTSTMFCVYIISAKIFKHLLDYLPLRFLIALLNLYMYFPHAL